jgi:hypothetical protein
LIHRLALRDDQVIERMGLEPRGESAPNSLFHCHTQAVGITNPPEMTFHEVHNYLRTPAAAG